MKILASSSPQQSISPPSHLRLVRDEADVPYDGQTKAERNGERFAMIPASVYALHEPYPILVYGALASYADRDGVCWPAMSTVAALVGISESTVMRAVKRLEDAGLIVREHTSNNGMKSANRYRLVARDCPQRKYRPTDGTYRQVDDHVPSHRQSRTVPQTDKQEPVEQQPEELPPLPPAELDEAAEERLRSFRAAYPTHRKSGNPREIAMLWAVLTVAEQQQAIAAIAVWSVSDDWTKEDGRYVPKITRYLTEHVWESRPSKAARVAPKFVV